MHCIELKTTNQADRVALRGIHVRSRLSGLSQKTTVEQTFINLEARAIEAVYTFPLPESAAVCHFEVVTDDRVLTGAIDENDAAIEKYESAIGQGHGAFLLEQSRPDVFTVRVGNIKPRQAATIRLTYVCALEVVDRQIRLAYPTTAAARYVTTTGLADPLDAVIDGDALNPPSARHVPYGLTLDVSIDLGRPLASVSSPTHAVRDEADGNHHRLSLTAGITDTDRDIVLSMALPAEQEPRVQTSRRNGDRFLAVTFVPEFDTELLANPAPAETGFVLDCSGSMMGASIAAAKTALELCLRSLNQGDTFNIYLFGSTFQRLGAEPLPYTQHTLDQAIQFVRNARDLGGTELYAPLQAIFSTPVAHGATREIVLLTDGQVSNEPAVIELARHHRASHRIFSFGIGAACSAHLVRGLARATRGAAEFITGNERIEEKVMRTFSRIGSPKVDEVEIDWGNADVQTLAELPAIFDGDALAVFGRTPGRLPDKVTLRCTTPAGEMAWSIKVPPATEDDGAIATMWARRAIQSLEETNGQRSLAHKSKELSRVDRELITLSKDFNVLCSLTSFVAIEHRSLAERNEGTPGVRQVPVRRPMIDLSRAMPMVTVASKSRAGCGGFPARRKAFFRGELKDSATEASLEQRRFIVGGAAAAGDVECKIDHSVDLEDLLKLQDAEGWFHNGDFTDPRFRNTSAEWLEAKALVDSIVRERAEFDTPARGRLGRTLLILALIEGEWPNRRDFWKRAFQKGCQCIARSLGVDNAEVVRWIVKLRTKIVPNT